MRKLKKSITGLFKLPLLMVVFAFFFINGCQKNYIDTNEGSDFLSIESDIDFNNLSIDRQKTLCLAFNRIDFVLENGYYKIQQKSGREINISEKLYNYFNTVIDNTNKFRKSIKLKLTIPRLKSLAEEDPPPPTSCLAYSITRTITALGGGGNFETVNGWIEETYGTNGVPTQYFGPACSHFLEGSTISPPTNYAYYNGGHIIVYINDGGDTAHACTLLTSNGSTVWVQDDENPETTFVAAFSSVGGAFEATGIQ